LACNKRFEVASFYEACTQRLIHTRHMTVVNPVLRLRVDYE